MQHYKKVMSELFPAKGSFCSAAKTNWTLVHCKGKSLAVSGRNNPASAIRAASVQSRKRRIGGTDKSIAVIYPYTDEIAPFAERLLTDGRPRWPDCIKYSKTQGKRADITNIYEGETTEILGKKLMLGGSMAAMLAAMAASADAQNAAQQTETVEVSASRISIQG